MQSGFIISMSFAAAALLSKSPEEYINILGGTRNLFDMSRGNVLPETQMPWGFNGFSPETDGTGSDQYSRSGFWFYSRSFRFFGMRLTHQPSPWCEDYGSMRFSAYLTDGNMGDSNSASAYDPAASTWLPYYQKHTMNAYCNAESCLTLEVTATEHGAIMRFKFPKDTSTSAAADAGWKATRRVEAIMNTKLSLEKGLPWINDTVQQGTSGPDGLAVLTGHTTRTDQGPSANEMKFAHYFYATVGGGRDGLQPAQPFRFGREGLDIGTGFLDFHSDDVDDDTLVLRVATSMISPTQAQANHAAEVQGVSFESAMGANKAAWHDVTSRMTINDLGPGYTDKEAEEWRTIVYSSMYRAAKYPRKLWEIDHATGKAIHWSPDTGKQEDGVFSTDQGFWDAYRTTYSWLALLFPERFAESMQGWLIRFEENGWVPQWAHPGSNGGMTGTMSDVRWPPLMVSDCV